MALVKTPDGGFYFDDSQFDVDYEENLVTLIDGGGTGPQGPAGPSKQGVAVPDVSGSEAADAITTINALLAWLRAAGLIANS